VNGVVVDGSTGEPVTGASIVAKDDKTIGTTSDHLGNFQLSLPPKVDALQVSLLGYETQIVTLTGRLPLEIVLTEDSQWLSEVIVVGYGSQKKETLTGSIAVIGSGGLVQSPVANISNALVGRAPGIMSTQASGEAGDNATTIRIRGVSTLNSGGHEPLIVIDGIQSSTSVMNALDANEIENISILKDASSTAVYGVKGANGVIIVTTKRGKSGAPKISMSYRYGVATLVSKLQMLGSYDYALFRNEAIQNDGNPSNYQYLFTEDELWKFQNNRDYTPTEVYSMNLTGEQEAALLNAPALYYGSHDYFEEQFGEVSPQQQYNLNISGGTDRMQYFASIGYFSEDGVFKNSDYGGADANSAYDRYNIRSNLDIDVFKNLKVSIDFGGQFETKKGILGNAQDGDVAGFYSRHKSMLVSILAGPPYAGPGIVDGKLVTAYAAYQNPLQGKGSGGYSPIAAILTKQTMRSRNTNLNSTIRLKHDMDYLTKGLSVSGTVSYSDLYMKGIAMQKWVPTYTAVRNPQNPVEILFFGGSTSPQTVTDNYRNNKWNRIYIEGKVDYARNFDEHSVTGLLLYNAQKTKDPGYVYNVPAGLIGIAGRFTYKYDDRYLFEFNMGYNGSENFPEGKRFGFFPAYSLGWVATNEKFIPKNKWLTWLKIRASYGEVGNDQIGGRRFLYLPNTWSYSGSSSGNGYFFGNTNGSSTDPAYNGAYESTLGNPNVTWERAKKTNIGLDFNLFNDQLSFIGDVFMENRDNILWNLGTVPSIVAATLPPDNIGKVSNKGYEIQVKWTSRIGAFEYSIGGNISYAVNKIEYMDEPQYPYEWMNTTGFSIGQYKGFKTAGFYNSWEEANNRPYVSLDGNKVQAGDIRYVDIDGDGVIDANDKIPIGYSNLPRYSFGANVDLAYKGFYISALFTGSHQGSMPMTSFYILNPFYMTSGAALQFQYDGRWTPEKVAQGIEPTFPRASVRTYDSQNGEMNDLWLRSSQFFRLKNVEFGYTFTDLGILKKYGLSGLRIFVSGSNLYTWGSKLIDGYDPEQEDRDGTSDGYLYPPIRTYNLGVTIQF
jgi:TonB-linked SusC/RagA family outer membrane protein